MTEMELTVNLLAVLVAAIVGVFVVGGLWYSPLLFGTIWKREAGIDPSKKERHSIVVFGISFVMGLLSAYAFALVLGKGYDLSGALYSGLYVGGLFVGTSFTINFLFSGRSIKILAIDGGYHIVQFTVYGLIFGLWH